MTESTSGAATHKPLGSTERSDNWWLAPASIAVGFAIFIIYATFRAFENQYYEVGNLLSPFYSPKLEFSWWHWSPAILILWMPAGFRATCYYYRKAYYRAYFVTPPACAVSGWKGFKYTGETKFPFVFQNLHRYMFYLAVVVLAVLWWDALLTLFRAGSFFHFSAFQVSVGTLVYFANVVLLSGYTFGCHAFRHLIGGRLDCFSCGETAKTSLSFWEKVSKLNEHHQLWAWLSLFSVGFADLYTTLVARGIWKDFILFSAS